MRLDHVSYVASHDQISDVVNRIGSQIGTAFVDGGIHPKFGTRNFTAPLLNGQYIEVVCPLDHPATATTPFGRAVEKKVLEGGGWMTWVLSTDHISEMEEIFGRKANVGQRKKPNGAILQWKQIGILDILNDSCQPYYIEWISKDHPSKDGVARSSLSQITIVGELDKTIINLNTLSFELKVTNAESDFKGISEVWFNSKGKQLLIN